MSAGDTNVTNLVASGSVDAPTLKINGTAITASAAEINDLAANNVAAADLTKLAAIASTAAEIDAAADQSGMTADGIHPLQVAVASFDATVAANQSIAAHGLGVSIPANSLVMGGWVDVNTHFHSAGADAGTIAISVESANDIISAAAVSGAPWSSIGRKAILPKINTPENAADPKTTVVREITATVAGQVLSDGKCTVYIIYMPGKVSA